MEGLWILAILWALMSFIGRMSKRPSGGPAEGRKPAPGPEPRRRLEQARAGRSPEPEGSAAEQLEAWRREMERLTGLRTGADYGPLGRPSKVRLPEAEDVEEREILGGEREARSLEVTGDRPPPEVVDQDEQADEVIRRRLEVAEARLTGLSKADHLRFDQQVRAAAPEAARRPATGAASRPRPGLRRALVWKEILDRPVSLREGS